MSQPIRLAIEMKLRKETKGTYVYDSVDDDAVITTVYIRKVRVFSSNPPKIINLIVEADNA
jgi:hypothetical protein